MGTITDFVARTYTAAVNGEATLSSMYDSNMLGYDNVIDFLNKQGIKFTWETTHEIAIGNNVYAIEVNVYMPGHVLHGRAYYDSTNYEDAHLRAIENALKMLYNKTASKTTVKEEPKEEKSVVKDANSVLDDLINNNQISEVNKSENKAEEIPFDQAEPVKPERGLKDFSEEEKNKMRELKSRGYDLDKMVNAWKPELKKSTDLTTKTIGDFLEWVEKLEKSQC